MLTPPPFFFLIQALGFKIALVSSIFMAAGAVTWWCFRAWGMRGGAVVAMTMVLGV